MGLWLEHVGFDIDGCYKKGSFLVIQESWPNWGWKSLTRSLVCSLGCLGYEAPTSKQGGSYSSVEIRGRDLHCCVKSVGGRPVTLLSPLHILQF